MPWKSCFSSLSTSCEFVFWQAPSVFPVIRHVLEMLNFSSVLWHWVFTKIIWWLCPDKLAHFPTAGLPQALRVGPGLLCFKDAEVIYIGTQRCVPLKVATELPALWGQECLGESEGLVESAERENVSTLPLQIVTFCNMEGLFRHLLVISIISQATILLKL